MPPNARVRAIVVVGNRKLESRTRAVGEATARAVLDDHADPGSSDTPGVIELANLADDLFRGDSDAVGAAKAEVLACDLLVVASPVYKASYTGLLKAFLDHFGRDELGALPTVPVMVGAGAEHALAVELHLRPVLVEIGACCPTRGVYVLENSLDTLSAQLQAWLDRWGSALVATMGVSRRRGPDDGTRGPAT